MLRAVVNHARVPVVVIALAAVVAGGCGGSSGTSTTPTVVSTERTAETTSTTSTATTPQAPATPATLPSQALATGRSLDALVRAYAPVAARLDHVVAAEVLWRDAQDNDAAAAVERDRAGSLRVEALRLRPLLLSARRNIDAQAQTQPAVRAIQHDLVVSLADRIAAVGKLGKLLDAAATDPDGDATRELDVAYRAAWNVAARAARAATDAEQDLRATSGLEPAAEDALLGSGAVVGSTIPSINAGTNDSSPASRSERNTAKELRALADAWQEGGGRFGYPFWHKAFQRYRAKAITASVFREYVTGYRDNLQLGCKLLNTVDVDHDASRDVRDLVTDACQRRVEALRAQKRELDAIVELDAATAADPLSPDDRAQLAGEIAEQHSIVGDKLQQAWRDTRQAMDRAQQALDAAGLPRLDESTFV